MKVSESTNLLAWQVGPPDFEWVAIVHAETRGKAKQMAVIEVGDYLDVRAKRLPRFDNCSVTAEALFEMGWTADEYPDHGLDPTDYTSLCGCVFCKPGI